MQKSLPDVDGGAFPEWNAKFVVKYRPPKSTSCHVLFNDVMKVSLGNSLTYVVIMVREAPDKSLFMTAYDSRKATEYEVSGGPVHWKYTGINNPSMKLPYEKFYAAGDEKETRIAKFSAELEVCIAKSEKLLLYKTPVGEILDQDIIRIGEV